MGAGDSKYVVKQEEFVSNNIDKYRKVLPNHYNTRQIKGKLRELYTGSDLTIENSNAYILKHDWINAKSKISNCNNY